MVTWNQILLSASIVLLFFLFYKHISTPKEQLAIELMERFRTKYHIPRMCIGLNKDQFSFGKCDYVVWNQTRKGDDNHFLARIASVSKTITAIAIFDLVERGLLSLDSKFIDIYKPKTIPIDPRIKTITIRQLLNHSGGWDSSKGIPKLGFPKLAGEVIAPFDPQYDSIKFLPNVTPQAIIEFMMSFPLNFDPGTRYSYSNFGYNILGRVIEAISGMRYDVFVRSHIFSKVGITDAFIGDENIDLKHKSELFYFDGDQGGYYFGALDQKYKVPDSYGTFVMNVMDAHGGWVMSCEDLNKFAKGMGDGTFISPKILQEILKQPPYQTSTKPNTFHSLGMRVRYLDDERVALMHNGALTWGTFSFLCVVLGKKHSETFVAIANHLDANYQAMTEELEDTVLERLL